MDSGPSSYIPLFGYISPVLLCFHDWWYGKKRPVILSSYPFKVKVSRKHKIVFWYNPRDIFNGFIWSSDYPLAVIIPLRIKHYDWPGWSCFQTPRTCSWKAWIPMGRWEVIPRKKYKRKSSSWRALFLFLEKVFILVVNIQAKKHETCPLVIKFYLCYVWNGSSLDNRHQSCWSQSLWIEVTSLFDWLIQEC